VTIALFASAALTSAFLIFWVEPLFAKLVLPLLGGSPAVWNTCLMYFQSMLLLGYLYAHASARLLPTRKQIILHVALLVLCFVQLPLGLPGGWEPPASGNVIPWLIGVLTLSLGAPFLVLSATAPLLQRWLATADPPVRNPYVLYAASNAGSFLGLLAFPLVFEPGLTLSRQSVLWSALYAFAVLLIGACGYVLWNRTRTTIRADEVLDDTPAPGWRDRLKWIALAFVPSSLLLGITTFLSTDVAATPLLWVIPLSLYLLTFVIVFSRGAERIAGAAALMHAVLVTILALVYFWQTSIGFRRAYALHLGVFALTALVLHGRLAASRPSPKYLTEFYLWMSFGGALGGAFTALLVPMIFDSTGDYLMMVAVACFLRPSFRVTTRKFLFERQNVAFALLPALLLYAISRRELDSLEIAGIPLDFVVSVIAAFFIIALMPSSVRFGVAIAAVGFAGYTLIGNRATLFSDRSFFGIYRVARGTGQVHLLYHGTTIHGAQFLDSARRLTPVTYYHPDGPVGDVFRVVQSRQGSRHIGIVGLGTGSILCYSRPGETWTFFEIDPKVADIANDNRFFSFLSDCAVKPRIVFGDARLTLAREQTGAYSLLVIDAFSSDAIPVHMLTREAVALYQRLVAEDGLLMLHISNRRLDLEPVVAELARDAGLNAMINNHHVEDSVQDRQYNYGSDWVVLARDTADFGPLASDTLWSKLVPARRTRPWTDDYSNIVSVIRW
jgi:hypothetical protein